MDEQDEDELTPEEAKERKILKLLLKIKNGTPPQRKTALRQITDKAREVGAGALFNQILPLLMSPTLEDQERHLVVKVIDRILYKLDDLVSGVSITSCFPRFDRSLVNMAGEAICAQDLGRHRTFAYRRRLLRAG